MKKNKCSALIISAFAIVSAPIISLVSSCAQKNTVQMTIDGAEDVLINQTEFPKNKDIKTKVITEPGTFDVIKISSIDINGTKIDSTKYQLTSDDNANYFLSISGECVTGDIFVHFTKTPGIAIIPLMSEESKEYINAHILRYESNKKATFVASLTDKGIRDNILILLDEITYYDKQEHMTTLVKDRDYQANWDVQKHEMTITINADCTIHNLNLIISNRINIPHYQLNTYMVHPSLEKGCLTVSNDPVEINTGEDLAFEIDIADWSADLIPNPAFQFLFTTQDGQKIKIKKDNLSIWINDIKQVEGKNYLVSDDNDCITSLDELDWFNYKVKIKMALENNTNPNGKIMCYPSFVPYERKPTPSTKSDLIKYTGSIGGLSTYGLPTYKIGSTVTITADMKNWTEEYFPENNVQWNLTFFKRDAEVSYKCLDPNNTKIWINDKELTKGTDFAFNKTNSSVYGIGNSKLLGKTDIIKFEIKILADGENDDVIDARPYLLDNPHTYDLTTFIADKPFLFGPATGLSLSNSARFLGMHKYKFIADLKNWNKTYWPEGGLKWMFGFVATGTGTTFSIDTSDIVIKKDDKELILDQDYTIEDNFVTAKEIVEDQNSIFTIEISLPEEKLYPQTVLPIFVKCVKNI